MENYNLLFPAFFALAAAESAALPAAVKFLLGSDAGFVAGIVLRGPLASRFFLFLRDASLISCEALTLARLALAAARILAIPAALIFRFFRWLGALVG